MLLLYFLNWVEYQNARDNLKSRNALVKHLIGLHIYSESSEIIRRLGVEM